MNTLVVYDTAGRINRLEAAIGQVQPHTIDAICMLGHVVAGTERRAAYDARRTDGSRPLPAHGNVPNLTDADLANLVAYLMTLKK